MTERHADVAEQLQEARQRLIVEYLEASRGHALVGPDSARAATGFQGAALDSIRKVRIRFQSALGDRARPR